jgi:hypothetical protein
MADAIPAPDMPTASNKTGNQQQLEATIAETMAPTFAISSPRLPRGTAEAATAPGPDAKVATGNLFALDAQQS